MAATLPHQDLVAAIPRLRRYARVLTGESTRADDLVQDTLARAWEKRALWLAGSDLRAWLFTIMHNLFVNQVRKASARSRHVSIDDDDFDDADMAIPASQTDSLEVRDLDFALQRLPAAQREVVLLVGLEEMSYMDVASALDIPIGTVMSRLSRGRERLRALMAGTRQDTKLKVVK
jgi:RNA polymerase sigma-70 factor (ECF subfamily)